MKVVSITVLAMALAGCAGTKYDGPGTPQDFTTAVGQCVREVSARGADRPHAYGGVSIGYPPPPACSAITTCLTARGYQQRPDGRFDVAAANVNCSH